MFRIDGLPWLSDTPKEEELKRLTVKQLLFICTHRQHRGLKPILIAYLMTFKKL